MEEHTHKWELVEIKTVSLAHTPDGVGRTKEEAYLLCQCQKVIKVEVTEY